MHSRAAPNYPFAKHRSVTSVWLVPQHHGPESLGCSSRCLGGSIFASTSAWTLSRYKRSPPERSSDCRRCRGATDVRGVACGGAGDGSWPGRGYRCVVISDPWSAIAAGHGPRLTPGPRPNGTSAGVGLCCRWSVSDQFGAGGNRWTSDPSERGYSQQSGSRRSRSRCQCSPCRVVKARRRGSPQHGPPPHARRKGCHESCRRRGASQGQVRGQSIRAAPVQPYRHAARRAATGP